VYAVVDEMTDAGIERLKMVCDWTFKNFNEKVAIGRELANDKRL
jgi:hypothetical protein